jgi:hypothetical protein
VRWGSCRPKNTKTRREYGIRPAGSENSPAAGSRGWAGDEEAACCGWEHVDVLDWDIIGWTDLGFLGWRSRQDGTTSPRRPQDWTSSGLDFSGTGLHQDWTSSELDFSCTGLHQDWTSSGLDFIRTVSPGRDDITPAPTGLDFTFPFISRKP